MAIAPVRRAPVSSRQRYGRPAAPSPSPARRVGPLLPLAPASEAGRPIVAPAVAPAPHPLVARLQLAWLLTVARFFPARLIAPKPRLQQTL